VTGLFDRVLVPYDGTASLDPAIEQLAPAIRDANGEVVVLRVVGFRRDGLNYYGTHPENGAAVYKRLSSRVQRELDAAVARLGQAGLRARATTVDGSVVASIIKTARSERASLIAVPRGAAPPGAVTRALISGAPAPVWVATVGDATARRGPRRILVPVIDGSQPAGLEQQVIQLARALEAMVALVRVMPSGAGARLRGKARSELDIVAERLRGAGVETEVSILSGAVSPTIIEAARTGVTLATLMLTHGHSTLGRWLGGSVTHAVLRRIDTPMLIVPAKWLEAGDARRSRQLTYPQADSEQVQRESDS